MKILYSFVFLLVLTVVSTAAWSVDYKVETAFDPGFNQFTTVNDLLVQSDGKVIAVGRTCQNNGTSCGPYATRLNENGTVDSTFNVAVSPVAQGVGDILTIKPLSNGQFLLTGDFNVGNQRTNYARINADGSLDATMQPASVGSFYILEPTPDGKYIACGDRTINGQFYDVAHRINADGSPDPTFRITFIAGFCTGVKALSNGKILMTVGYNSGETPIKPLYRINVDGSQDTSFDAAMPVGTGAGGLTILPDGKLLVRTRPAGFNDDAIERLLPDGQLDTVISLCKGILSLPLSDGTVINNGCRKWNGYFGNPLEFSRFAADGTVDAKLDNIYFGDPISGFRDAGNDRYYVFGNFRSVNNNTNHRKLVRLAPDLSLPRAKFDFDGDGKSDLAVFRPSDRFWYIYGSTAGYSNLLWGLSTDKPIASHFDRDGKTDIAVFRDGTWHGFPSTTASWVQMPLGQTGDKPMVGNFEDSDVDVEEYAVRGVRNGAVKWFIRQGNAAGLPVSSPSERSLTNEQPTDIPVVGDFNGDGRDEVGYFRNGFWNSGDYRSYLPDQTFQWGISGDIPVPADYDGDRQTDYAVFRPSTGVWWVNASSSGAFAVRFGISSDIPVPADYDGDGKTDIAVYRDGQWWQLLVGSGIVQVANWGLAGDIPIPAQSQSQF